MAYNHRLVFSCRAVFFFILKGTRALASPDGRSFEKPKGSVDPDMATIKMVMEE